MLNAIIVTLPFFALIGIGYLAGRREFVVESGIKGLHTFVFYFALPCLIFRALATRPISDIANPRYMGIYLAAGLLAFTVTAVMGRLFFKSPLGIAALQGQAGSVGNVGFLGIPLIIALLGNGAALPVILGWTIDMVVLVPLSIALLEISRQKSGTDFFARVLKGVALNPFFLSIVAGAAYAALGLALPEPVDRFTDLLARAAGPCALFTLGATMAGKPISSGLSEALYLTVMKLAFYPLVMFLLMAILFEIDPLWMKAAVMVAALPVAGNVYIIAQSFDLYVMRASTTILTSTALGMATFSILAAFLTG